MHICEHLRRKLGNLRGHPRCRVLNVHSATVRHVLLTPAQEERRYCRDLTIAQLCLTVTVVD